MPSDQTLHTASVLDRLLQSESGISRQPVRDRLMSIGEIKTLVIRDLEKLLNTKRQLMSPAAAYREVNNSLMRYGLEDYTSQNPRSQSVKQNLRLDIEKTIRQFEPRLKDARVQFETPNQKEHNLRFRITALLVVEPSTEPVTFDTQFDVSRGEYKINK